MAVCLTSLMVSNYLPNLSDVSAATCFAYPRFHRCPHNMTLISGSAPEGLIRELYLIALHFRLNISDELLNFHPLGLSPWLIIHLAFTSAGWINLYLVSEFTELFP